MDDLTNATDQELEQKRAALQNQRDAILAQMHAIATEQETRIARGKMKELLRALPEDRRRALLAEGTSK